MEIFLDTSDVAEIGWWLETGVVDGVTTNPSIMLKDGHTDLEAGARKIAELVHPLPVSIEVTTTDLEAMLAQGREIAAWADNISVKITVITEHGDPALRVVRTLADDGIVVNCTACLSFGQAVLAAKAGARYVSLFVGRIADEGNDATAVLRNVRAWLDGSGRDAKIIAGSMRTVMDVQQSAVAGAHIVTMPPAILRKLVDHRYSRATVQQFLDDSHQAFEQIESFNRRP